MRPLTEGEILEVWERGRDKGAEEQALAPLWVVEAGGAGPPWLGSRDGLAALLELAALPVGQRDERLLRLRQATLGSQLSGAASCPGCGKPVDFVVGVDEVLAAGSGASSRSPAALRLVLEESRFELELRPLDSRDLALAAEAGNLPAARRRLFELAVTAARRNGEPISVNALPVALEAPVGAALEALDPLAVVPLAMACNRCGRQWQPLLDTARYVWRELSARAERLLLDVHTLAQGYGWTEQTVLGMSPSRRQFYLENVPNDSARSGEGESGGTRR